MTSVGMLRDVTDDDVEAVLDLVLLSDLAEVGEPNTSIDEVRADIASGDLRNALLEDPAGGLLGYVWLEHQPGHLKSWGDITVKPGADISVASTLLDWLRETAATVAPGLPIHVFADSKNQMKRRLYEAAGGTVIRGFYRMAITFDDTAPPVVPAVGDGVAIRGVTNTEADLRAMHKVVDAAFGDHFGHEPESYEQWAQHTVHGASSDLSLWWLATVAGEPVAGLYGFVLPTAGYVDTLGTLRAHRGKGLARALLLTSFAAFYRRGLRKVVLGVDATNPTGAVALYESVGMRAEHQGVRYELR